MDIFVHIRYFAFLIYCYLMVLVLWKDSKSALNISCAAILSSLILWVFSDFFVLNINTPEEIAVLFNNIGSIGWIGISSFFLWFTFIFSEKKTILKSKFTFPFLFIPPVLLIFMQWTGYITSLIHVSFGWLPIWSNSIWSYLFYLYYLSFMIGAVYLLFNFKKKTKELTSKKRTEIILITLLIPLVFGSLTDVLLPNLNIHSIPPILDIIMLIWAAGLVYAIIKYKLLTITPVVAAEKIISTMADSLILLNKLGDIVTVNNAIINLSGYAKNEMERKSIEVLFAENDFKRILLDKAIKGEDFRNYEINLKTKGEVNIPVIFSSTVLLDEAGIIAGIICIAKDITELKKAEEKLKKQNEEIQLLAEELRINTTNLQETNVLLEERQQQIEDQTEELKATNEELYEKQVYIEEQSEELRAHSENLKDINDLLIEKQEQILAQSKQLKDNNQQLSLLNATKDKFFTIIAHDLRNPFNIVSGFSEILLINFDTLTPEKIRKYLELIYTSSKSGNNLLENLLQWSRSQTGHISYEPAKINLCALAKGIINLLGSDAERKSIVIEQLIDPNIFVIADENMIKTIFRNLISNAIKFTKENGTITLKSVIENQQVKVIVADTGVGIQEENIKKLFRIDTTITTKGTAKESGTGLGLLLCKEFVEKHNGKIWVESVIDKGSAFHFTLSQN